MNECAATDHAYDRAKERLGWKKSTLDRMMVKAYEEGVKHYQTSGPLRKYLDKKYLRYRTAGNIRIYGENVFIFKKRLLLTVYRIDGDVVKYLK